MPVFSDFTQMTRPRSIAQGNFHFSNFGYVRLKRPFDAGCSVRLIAACGAGFSVCGIATPTAA